MMRCGTIAVTIVLVGMLVACQKESSEQDWYLLAANRTGEEAVSVSPFGGDRAKCDKFAAEFSKQSQSRCVSGREFEQLQKARQWRCALNVCVAATKS